MGGTALASCCFMVGKNSLILFAGLSVLAVVASGCAGDEGADDESAVGGSGGADPSTSGGRGPGGSGGSTTGGSSQVNTGGTREAGGAMGMGAMGGGANTSCFSPTQGLSWAYDAGSEGCPCSEDLDRDRCIDGVGLVCEEGSWHAVEDGPCAPSTCTQPLDVDLTCDVPSHVGFWHNAETGQCEPFVGGCPRNDNGFLTFEECSETCQEKVTAMAVVPWEECAGLGEQITESGDEASFTLQESTIQKQFDWSCGCQTRPVFTMAYRPTSPLELRLCKDVGADTCEAHCSSTLTFDLSYALQDAGATEFVFAD